jgi:hypothetical protein
MIKKSILDSGKIDWAHTCLSYLERDRTISGDLACQLRMQSPFAFLYLFQCTGKVLAALKTLVSQ